MPILLRDYECELCGRQFEEWGGRKRKDFPPCPHCGTNEHVKRKLYRPTHGKHSSWAVRG
jgi:putative FmdB family regulatory protein